MDLFQEGKFTLHSGEVSNYKIEMDAISSEEWAVFAKLAVDRLLPRFGSVVGVPNGGLPFAAALEKYITPGVRARVICDDVLTTGASMEEMGGNNLNDVGIVVFARGPLPWWVNAIFIGGWI